MNLENLSHRLPFARQSVESRALMGSWSRDEVLLKLERRESLLRAASLAASHFLSGEWRDHITEVLAALGAAAEVSHVYFTENHTPEREWVFETCYEWSPAEIYPCPGRPRWQNLDWAGMTERDWGHVLSTGGVLHGLVESFPDAQITGVVGPETVAIAAVPVRVNGNWWGTLGFDECREPRSWDEAEIEVMHLIADMLGAAVSRGEADQALRLTEAKYRSIFENAIEGIFQTSPDGNYLDANPSLASIYGYDSPYDLINGLTDITRQLYIDPRRRSDFIQEMRDRGQVSNFEAQIRRRDGEIIWISENARSVHDEHGTLLYYEGTVEDITARRDAADQLLHNALHDKLTGLPNRALCMDRLAQAFRRLKRHPDALFAVLFIDFDRFKSINDSLGHMAGDQLLMAVASRLKSGLRPQDTIARLGGDEFAILIEDLESVMNLAAVAERIQHDMMDPFLIVGQEVFSSVSIGIAPATPEYERPEDLLRDADMAMYRAKTMGRGRFVIFDGDMHIHAVSRLQLETDLRYAIDRSEFKLYYQPIVDLELGRVTGFEALIRWQHPERGLVSPAEFIPVAEETGWIVPIGRWVLQEACEQLVQWQKDRPLAPPLTMSVNLSGKQFSQPDLIPFIEGLLKETGLEASTLKLEITESSLMENAKVVIDRLLRLRSLGVKLALDDFGTGYSSLSYLHQFPLDTLKIDRSFIARMSEDVEHREIVRTIISLGKNLGMDVVAEGVEGNDQLADLRDLDCNHGQGYLFARPLTSQAALTLLMSETDW